MTSPSINKFIKTSDLSIMPIIEKMTPWEATSKIEFIIKELLKKVDLSEYNINDDQAIHQSATIEPSAKLKGPMIIGSNCFVANGSLLRGGVILDSNCCIGHCSEVKTSIFIAGSKAAHFNFVGDGIIGNKVNIESGVVLANYRNELTNKEIIVTYQDQKISTGVQKFGTIIGDESKIGANAVLAPGTLLPKNSIIKRGASIDQLFT